MQNHSDEMNLKHALELANSPAGRQLLTLLQQSDSAALQKAMASASAGDYESAKHALGSLTASPEVRQLLQQLGG